MLVEEFSSIVDSVGSSNDNVLLVGDFNVHVDNDTNPESVRFAELLEDANLVQHVEGSTHMSGHTLDLVIARIDADLVTLLHVNSFLSDHAAINFTCCPDKRSVPVKSVAYTGSFLTLIWMPPPMMDVHLCLNWTVLMIHHRLLLLTILVFVKCWIFTHPLSVVMSSCVSESHGTMTRSGTKTNKTSRTTLAVFKMS